MEDEKASGSTVKPVSHRQAGVEPAEGKGDLDPPTARADEGEQTRPETARGSRPRSSGWRVRPTLRHLLIAGFVIGLLQAVAGDIWIFAKDFASWLAEDKPEPPAPNAAPAPPPVSIESLALNGISIHDGDAVYLENLNRLTGALKGGPPKRRRISARFFVIGASGRARELFGYSEPQSGGFRLSLDDAGALRLSQAPTDVRLTVEVSPSADATITPAELSRSLSLTLAKPPVIRVTSVDGVDPSTETPEKRVGPTGRVIGITSISPMVGWRIAGYIRGQGEAFTPTRPVQRESLSFTIPEVQFRVPLSQGEGDADLVIGLQREGDTRLVNSCDSKILVAPTCIRVRVDGPSLTITGVRRQQARVEAYGKAANTLPSAEQVCVRVTLTADGKPLGEFALFGKIRAGDWTATNDEDLLPSPGGSPVSVRAAAKLAEPDYQGLVCPGSAVSWMHHLPAVRIR